MVDRVTVRKAEQLLQATTRRTMPGMCGGLRILLFLLPARKVSPPSLIPQKLDPLDLRRVVENFLEEVGMEETKKMKILRIIKGIGLKVELAVPSNNEFGAVQDAHHFDSMGIAHCFTFGGNRNKVLHDPAIHPRSDLSKEQYMKKEEHTAGDHFHEKLLKLKDLMKTKAGQKRAESRHKFIEDFLEEFYGEWDGRA